MNARQEAETANPLEMRRGEEWALNDCYSHLQVKVRVTIGWMAPSAIFILMACKRNKYDQQLGLWYMYYITNKILGDVGNTMCMLR